MKGTARKLGAGVASGGQPEKSTGSSVSGIADKIVKPKGGLYIWTLVLPDVERQGQYPYSRGKKT